MTKRSTQKQTSLLLLLMTGCGRLSFGNGAQVEDIEPLLCAFDSFAEFLVGMNDFRTELSIIEVHISISWSEESKSKYQYKVFFLFSIQRSPFFPPSISTSK